MSTFYRPTRDGDLSRSCLNYFEACASEFSRHGNVRKWIVSFVSIDLLSVIPQENPSISGL